MVGQATNTATILLLFVLLLHSIHSSIQPSIHPSLIHSLHLIRHHFLSFKRNWVWITARNTRSFKCYDDVQNITIKEMCFIWTFDLCTMFCTWCIICWGGQHSGVPPNKFAKWLTRIESANCFVYRQNRKHLILKSLTANHKFYYNSIAFYCHPLCACSESIDSLCWLVWCTEIKMKHFHWKVASQHHFSGMLFVTLTHICVRCFSSTCTFHVSANIC